MYPDDNHVGTTTKDNITNKTSNLNNKPAILIIFFSAKQSNLMIYVIMHNISLQPNKQWRMRRIEMNNPLPLPTRKDSIPAVDLYQQHAAENFKKWNFFSSIVKNIWEPRSSQRLPQNPRKQFPLALSYFVFSNRMIKISIALYTRLSN